ncbi:MAG: hypothetical protein ABI343_06480 [Burkholderiaceae bacterium]
MGQEAAFCKDAATAWAKKIGNTAKIAFRHGQSGHPAVHIHFPCDRLAAMDGRFANACQRAQAGEPIDEAHATFLSFQAMTETLSPRRLELLRRAAA